MKLPFRIISLLTMAMAIVASFFFQPVSPAYADSAAMAAMQGIVKMVDVKDGSFGPFSVSTTIPPLPGDKPLRIGSALVSLSPDTLKEGVVKSIKITRKVGNDDIIEFGCVNLKVSQGTDLIKSCGGPALLAAGETTYEATGTNFGPEPNGTFSIQLIP